ncbi:hypothetical protein [Pantoea septica]|uniref:hypothetical protein n=1 Tax=Pantoea septica TaxID=472695 RepID=UPI003D025BFC
MMLISRIRIPEVIHATAKISSGKGVLTGAKSLSKGVISAGAEYAQTPATIIAVPINGSSARKTMLSPSGLSFLEANTFAAMTHSARPK